jgi:hypothetical protein
MHAEAEQRSRMVRIAAPDLEPHSLRFVPAPGACQAPGVLDELLD